MRILIATLLIATLSACGAENDNRRTGSGDFIYPSEQGIETDDRTQKRSYTDGVIDMSADQRSMDRSSDATAVTTQDDMGLTSEDDSSGVGGGAEAIGDEFTTDPVDDDEPVDELTDAPDEPTDTPDEPRVTDEGETSVDEFGSEELSEEELMAEAGAALYVDNCMSCHNALEETTKAGRTAEHILEALATVGQMGNLGPFSAEEIDQLVVALDFTE